MSKNNLPIKYISAWPVKHKPSWPNKHEGKICNWINIPQKKLWKSDLDLGGERFIVS